MVSDRSCFGCGVEYVRSKSVGYVGARRKMSATLKRTSGCALFREGLRSLVRTRNVVRLLLRYKATVCADTMG